MKLIAFLFTVITIVACADKDPADNTTQTNSDIAKSDTMVYGEMKKYWMVFLKSGPNRKQDSASAARIQERHIANIDRLAKEGVIIMAGPMGDKTDLKGIFIMNCKDSLDAVNYVKTDTAIITGRLVYEIHPWWTAQGKYHFK